MSGPPRPASAPTAGVGGRRPRQTLGGRPATGRRWLRDNIEQSLPFVLCGVFCIGVAVWLEATQAHVLGARLPLWPLVAGIGATFAGGGFALTILEEPALAGGVVVPDGYVMVERAEWERRHPELGSGEWAPDVAPETLPAQRSGERSSAAPWTAHGFDVAEIREASDDLLQATRPRKETLGEEGVPAISREAKPRFVGPPRPGPPISVELPPTAQGEAALDELESVLSDLGREGATGSPSVGRPRPATTTDRCVACGTEVASYSEQICVACDRPLCDACLDRTAMEGHPAMCPSCSASMKP
jgi:hypothetical protein